MRVYPRKLNIGCGYDRREGFLNVDADERTQPDLLADVRDLSALPEGYFDEILALDVLEHLPRTDTARALAGWTRLLRPGGTIRVRVPSYLHLVERLLCTEDYDSPEHHRGTIHLACGTQAHGDDFHHTCFTPLLLREYLHDAGLGIRQVTILDGWMFDVVAQRGVVDAVDPTTLWGSRWRFVYRIARSLVREKAAAARRRLRWRRARPAVAEGG